SSARIYVASAGGVLYAFKPDGSFDWGFDTVGTFQVGPAVVQATTVTTPVDEIVIPDSVGGGNSLIWRATSASAIGVASDERDFLAAPLILNGKVYYASQNRNSGPTITHVSMQTIGADGVLGATITNAAAGATVVNPAVAFYGLVTDGTSVYAATAPASGAGALFAFNGSLSQTWTKALTAGLAGEPTFGIDGKLYASELSNSGVNSATFDPTNGNRTGFVSIGGATGIGMVPLQGSDGHIYFPRRSGQGLFAYKGNQLSWTLKTPGNTLRYATMDCQGRLFSAAGSTVFAFVSDDTGLADTAWPNLRRDSRNTGNASTGWTKYGMRTAAGPAGCIQ
ncbi:MAG TPA: hypothetical protein VFE90_12505, partial [Myxococcales bacterium]|nr:hypothetical protein [Myxococcales bacterium]